MTHTAAPCTSEAERFHINQDDSCPHLNEQYWL